MLAVEFTTDDETILEDVDIPVRAVDIWAYQKIITFNNILIIAQRKSYIVLIFKVKKIYNNVEIIEIKLTNHSMKI